MKSLRRAKEKNMYSNYDPNQNYNPYAIAHTAVGRAASLRIT